MSDLKLNQDKILQSRLAVSLQKEEKAYVKSQFDSLLKEFKTRESQEDHKDKENLIKLYIVGYLITKEVSRKHKLKKVKLVRKSFTDCLGEIHLKLYSMMIKYALDNCNYIPFLCIFRLGKIIDEYSLVLGSSKSRKALIENGLANKKSYIDMLKEENLKLQNLENPYGIISEPVTYQIINSSIELAQENQIFNEEYWQPFVKSKGAKYIREFKKMLDKTL